MKKKIARKFSLQRRGYSISEVDNYINGLNNELNSLRERMSLVDNLKEENQKITSELEDFRQREGDIKAVLSVALDKANDIKTDVKLQYAMEIERLKIFQAKWTNSYEELNARYHFDKDVLTMEGVVADTALQIEGLLNKDFGIKLSPSGDEAEQQFKAEIQRLEISQEEINNLVERLKSELKKVG